MAYAIIPRPKTWDKFQFQFAQGVLCVLSTIGERGVRLFLLYHI